MSANSSWWRAPNITSGLFRDAYNYSIVQLGSHIIVPNVVLANFRGKVRRQDRLLEYCAQEHRIEDVTAWHSRS